MSELVSIITPCYNGEKYVRKYLDSILSQTYPSIELIFVNDGSSDSTEEIVLSYKSRFEDKGYSFIYLFQENAGQSAAMNQGLKVFSGEYLMWVDSDDYLVSTCVEDKADYLDSHADVAGVCGKVAVNVGGKEQPDNYLGTLHKTGDVMRFADVFKPDFNWCPLSFMVRSDMFREAMPKPLQILAPRVCGQNAQMILPTLYKYPFHHIDSLSGYYVVHSDSHSHSINTFEKNELSVNTGEQLLYGIVDGMDISENERDTIKKAVKKKVILDHLENHSHYRRQDNLEALVSQLKEIGELDLKSRLKIIKIKYPFAKKIGDAIWRMRNR